MTSHLLQEYLYTYHHTPWKLSIHLQLTSYFILFLTIYPVMQSIHWSLGKASFWGVHISSTHYLITGLEVKLLSHTTALGKCLVNAGVEVPQATMWSYGACLLPAVLPLTD